MSFRYLVSLFATFIFGAAILTARCTSQTNASLTLINFNLPSDQQSSLAPSYMRIFDAPDLNVSRIEITFITGDAKHPFRTKNITRQQAEKIYNKDCPDGPFIDFPNATGSSQTQLRALATAATGSSFGRAATVMDFADFDGDGNFDVVDALTGAVTVRLQDATASALSVTPYKVAVNDPFVIAADVNGNGFPDLVVTDDGAFGTSNATGGIWVLLNKKDGTFGAALQYAAGAGPVSVVAADFNGDGKLDLVAADSSASTIAILIGNGDGTFKPAVMVQAGSRPSALVAADFNQDGKQDIALIDSPTNSLLVLSGNGDGTFQQARSFPGGPLYGDLIFGDFNNDGSIDLIASYAQAN